MKNFEHIDDFLANRLADGERKAFEEQIAGDPALREEVNFQRELVEGVRKARAQELKSMLQQVPVAGGVSWGGLKMAAAVVGAGVIAASLYFYNDNNEAAIPAPDNQATATPAQPESTIKESPTEEVKPGHEEVTAPSESKPAKKSPAPVTTKKADPVSRPNFEAMDQSEEITNSEAPILESTSNNRMEISIAKMDVVTGISDKKHGFHYQFSQGKLLLYGPFDKNLYEILEVHGDNRSLFLFYRENYYLLNEKEFQITPLKAISDGELIKRLREYRSVK
ncbi:MAG TPA: hypothetical protein PLX35_09935 [Cyclobacteriaceae bacterium]|nr:hypothetical protein [Cyclobacteriaceae bacterium]